MQVTNEMNPYQKQLGDDYPSQITCRLNPGTRCTNKISITIQIRWEFHLALIQLLVIILQQNLAHVTTAHLSCYLQQCVAITALQFG